MFGSERRSKLFFWAKAERKTLYWVLLIKPRNCRVDSVVVWGMRIALSNELSEAKPHHSVLYEKLTRIAGAGHCVTSDCITSQLLRIQGSSST